VKVLTTILPPILVVMVACVIGVVVAAILLPLLDMQDAASRM
jgi:type II secretory pathway component PulF